MSNSFDKNDRSILEPSPRQQIQWRRSEQFIQLLFSMISLLRIIVSKTFSIWWYIESSLLLSLLNQTDTRARFLWIELAEYASKLFAGFPNVEHCENDFQLVQHGPYTGSGHTQSLEHYIEPIRRLFNPIHSKNNSEHIYRIAFALSRLTIQTTM